MKNLKIYAICLSMLTIISSCGTAQKNGQLIGGGAGAVVGAGLGALIGHLAGGSTKATLIGTAIGTAVGAGGGVAIGNAIGKKMDKAKAAAEAVANAQVEAVQDNNGLEAVKVTFDSGILFDSGKSTLKAAAQKSLTDFATNVLKVYTDCDVAVMGFTDNDPWKNSTAEQSTQKNLELSQKRAQSVTDYLLGLGVANTQIKSTTGFGEAEPVADNSTAAGKAQNRRVEVYLYASQAMIEAAKNGTLQ